MPHTVTCPHCTAKLTSQTTIPAGKSINCPKCKTAFVVAEEEDDIPVAELVEEAKPTAAGPAPVPAPATTAAPVSASATLATPPTPSPPPLRKGVNAGRSSSHTRDDEDDRPRASRRRDEDDEEEDRPRRRSRRDEEDDEDEDDRPRSRRRNDEDEDRPRPRLARDEDEDDGPPRRRPQKKKSRALLWTLLAMGGGFGAIAVGLILYFFVFETGGAPSEMVAWAPSDADHAVFIDCAGLQANPDFSRLPNNGMDLMPDYGVDRDQLSKVFYSTGKDGSVTAVKTILPVDREGVIQRLGSRGSTQMLTTSGKTYYQVPAQGYVYFASDRLLVFAKNQAALKNRLDGRDPGGGSPELKSAMSRARGDAWSVHTPTRGRLIRNGDQVESMVESMSFSGGKVEGTAEIVFADEATAARVYAVTEQSRLISDGTVRTYKSGRKITVKTSHPIALAGGGIQEFTMYLR